LPGAGVVFFWGDESTSAALRGDRAVVQVDTSGSYSRVSVDSDGAPVPTRYTHTLPLLAGPDGSVSARLPPDRIVGVVAAADGWTEEWVPAFGTGHEGAMQLKVPLYHERLSLDLTGTIGPGGLSTAYAMGDGKALWYPQDVKLGAAPDATPGYLARLVDLQGVLNWTNGPLSFGDLALAAGPDNAQPAVVRDTDTDVAAGPRSQNLDRGLGALREEGFLAGNHLYAGPATRTGYFGPMGLPYTLHLTLTMDRARAFRQTCGVDVNAGGGPTGVSAPGAGIALVVALLGMAAVPRRRRSA
jgi:hypothetical protein